MKLKYDKLHSSFASNINLHPYILGTLEVRGAVTWNTAGPTIGVQFLPGATVTEAIAYTAGGHIVADGADFGSANFWSVAGRAWHTLLTTCLSLDAG